MNYVRFTLLGLMGLLSTVNAQTYLTPSDGYKSAWLFSRYASVSAFDLSDSLLYVHGGDTIREIDLETGVQRSRFVVPEDYTQTHYASFLTLDPDGKGVWVGYTSDGNTDDRIYRLEPDAGRWTHAATFPSNLKLTFWNGHILVSGLNSTRWEDPNSVFLLDTTGQNLHRKIIELEGNGAGMDVDEHGHLYAGTSLPGGTNGLYRWDSAQIAEAIKNPGQDTLGLEDAEQLAVLPMGLADCAVDASGTVVFNMNQFGASQVMAQWNGIAGDAPNYDTLAIATGEFDWLWYIRIQGKAGVPERGNRIITLSFGRPLAELHTMDYPPRLENPLPDFFVRTGHTDTTLSLSEVFSDPDDPDSLITKSIAFNSDPEWIQASIHNDSLTLKGTPLYLVKSEFHPAEIVLEGISAGLTVSDTMQVNLEVIGRASPNSSAALSVFPNPSGGRFTLEAPGIEGASLKVITASGIEYFSREHIRDGDMIDLGHPVPGVYLLMLVHEGGITTRLIQIR